MNENKMVYCTSPIYQSTRKQNKTQQTLHLTILNNKLFTRQKRDSSKLYHLNQNLLSLKKNNPHIQVQ